MPEITNYTVSGVACDARGCNARITGPELTSFKGRQEYTDRAADAGWTVWVSRSRRYYCPEHEPSRGHRVDLIAGTPRNTGTS